MKSGFISIVGRPNVGKSTLLNKIIGEKIAIISDKPQTTRNNIIGIYTDNDSQLVFTDTPGIHKPRTKLGNFMNKAANTSVSGVDAILFVCEPKLTSADEIVLSQLSLGKTPVILVINKIDTIKKENLFKVIEDFSHLYDFAEIIPISAKADDGVDILLNAVKPYIEEGPMFYPEDMMTDQTEREIVAEIIREKLLYSLSDEIPHGTAIEIFKMEEKPDIVNIEANIYCEKKSHKGIIIGKGGSVLKKVGSDARRDIEDMLGSKVFLQLWVKVKEDWRNSDFYNKNFGYDMKKL